MSEITVRQAIQKGLMEALDSDPDVFIMGEDIGAYGGAYAITSGFLEKYGPERIKDTPISEAAFIGAGIGSAAAGLKPIVELMSISFSLVGFDQIVNMAANIRYMSGGQVNVPMVIRAPTGAGMQLGATHSQSFETWLCEVPGLKVVAPSNPSDALGLIRSSIKDPNPVIYAESAGLYGLKGEVNDKYYEIEIGKADIKIVGEDITLVSYGHGMPMLEKVSEELKSRGVSSEVIDLRSLSPMDYETVNKSVQKTGRALLLDTARKTGGVMAELAASVQESSGDYLDGPLLRVGSEDVPWPYNRKLEQHAMSSVPKILKQIKIGYSL
ncbi:MAG: alpha-ketoacid dehydrogenase subunit beta [Dehalococcoidia bacterium]|nr:alpha-ketoacid dehydrogenase subunit beta [Dehalococcoidia bacterium]MEC7921340.1 alpha-ketoacid dehydrogenase subunit beta [Chloroflexota bacterium]MEC9450903.1 alpha-ketoacid dehydrogenase subunit beta [Chloroflexota bacterium]|tara:strand:- start:9490 stop:10467 length:978 start_codon:yes stop_codon:yes gene_type:complete